MNCTPHHYKILFWSSKRAAKPATCLFEEQVNVIKRKEKYDVIILSLNWLYFTVLTRNSDVGIDLQFLRL